jgi:hypothetical protein
MTRMVAGASIEPGPCGEDDITAENLEQMATTLESRPPTESDRRELADILRWMARLVREIDAAAASDADGSTASHTD